MFKSIHVRIYKFKEFINYFFYNQSIIQMKYYINSYFKNQ